MTNHPQPRRLMSLDALRGLTIAAMIVVNFPGSEDHVFFTLRHTVWNGLSFTDQVAPFFLFMVGMSIVFAYSRRLREGIPKAVLYRKIFIRSLKIFAVGMLMNLMPHFDFSTVRWTGTLQRIAVVFLCCSLLYLHTNWKQQAWIAGILLVSYWLALTLIPVPGVGKVMLEPGVNIVAWVDSKYLPGRMWRGSWDPESILTTVTSVVSGITGMLAGALLQGSRPAQEKVNILMTAGVFTALGGYFWGLAFPVNENLWTSSFVLVTAGFAALLFGAIYFLVDVSPESRPAPVHAGKFAWATFPGIVLGANAITIYFLADIWALFFYEWKPGGAGLNDRWMQGLTGAGCNAELASLLYALLFMGFNFIPAWWLYRKKVFIRL